MLIDILTALIVALILVLARAAALYAVYWDQVQRGNDKFQILIMFRDWSIWQRIKFILGLTVYGKAKDFFK